jgi:hypothetical protein
VKPFQFYTVKNFPKLKAGAKLSTVIQLTLFGEGEDVETNIIMETPDFEGPLDLMRIKSEIRHEACGYIKTVIGSKRKKLDFFEYLQPVDFQAYHATQKKLVIFQAPKKVCRGVLANLNRGDCGVKLIEMAVDFVKVLDLWREYSGAWFRKVSSRVNAAGLSGQQIQQDPLFKKLLKDGVLSNVTIPWKLDDSEHRVMITANCAIILEQDYKANLGLELKIVMDVYEQLLSKVREERKPRKT